MKKIFLINLFAIAVLCTAFASIQYEKTECNSKCSSCCKKTKPIENKVIGGSEDNDDEIFQFNRIYIKM